MVSPDEALKRLLEGNRRYAQEKSIHPNRDQERRSATIKAQQPFAVILGCSDSRVPAEVLFDAGIGDLFVVRVAGNVLGPIELASIRLATTQLGVNFVFVLGHESCSAVNAVLSKQSDLIAPIADLIDIGAATTLEDAVKTNIKHITAQLSKELDIAVAGGYYSLEIGRVNLI
ncbi:MAG: carbonic anhydrase [Simkaniaceae bacterium]|nr:carbonic anhydrase [Candidatus Sacchlamyda saccharinae]